ncbi:MAG: UPF0164 family protein [Treponema sp.]|nr:UPF0164 family protein [Treponema sp.]
MRKRHFLKLLILFSTLSLFSNKRLTALSYSDLVTNLSDVFYGLVDENEGQTSFRSLLIPFGGRSESMAGAYTGLCDDIGFFQYNAGAGSIQKESQIALFHNMWIADSKMETIALTTRFKNIPHLSLGGYISCFYLPFTEYNIFGDRVAASYYSESVAAINVSYNILAGYDFKGLALGASLKAAWRGMPNYTDNNTNEIISNSGLEQSGLAFMGDIGLMLQFNFLKYYYSRDPNVRIGLSAQNLGVSFTGWGKDVVLDDPLPTLLCAGISLKFIKPITFTAEFQQPINLQNPGTYLKPYLASGVSFEFTNFLSLLGGFALKGANPRFSAGFEFEIKKIRFNFNYTLDFTSSFSPLNKISLSVKIKLGDKGRSIIDKQVDEYYQQGLIFYAQADYQAAIDVWEEALKLNKRFDPAKLGIQSAQYQIDMFQKIKESLLLDQF